MARMLGRRRSRVGAAPMRRRFSLEAPQRALVLDALRDDLLRLSEQHGFDILPWQLED